jgi:predicted adenylyl cyclase CyaB
MSIVEIELRFKVPKAYSAELQRRLADAGFKAIGEVRQKDVYFTNRHKDFIENEECLRLRQEDGSVTLTWKPPSSDEMKAAPDFWKREIDLDLAEQLEVARDLLHALDFLEYVTVEKVRSVFINEGGVEVALDSVAHVGDFVEIEVKSAEVDRGRELIRQIAVKLGLSDSWLSTTPYRDLVKASG